MTVYCCYLMNLSDRWCVTVVKSLSWQYLLQKSFYSANVDLKWKPLENRTVQSDKAQKILLDELTMVQLQREDFSLLDIKLPQHFPGSYSQHSLIKAITQSRKKHLV